MRFKIVTDFFKVAESQRHRVAKFLVTESVEAPNTRLRQAQSPEYLKNHAALL